MKTNPIAGLREELTRQVERLRGFLQQDPGNEPLRAELFDLLLSGGAADAAVAIARERAADDASGRWLYREAVALRLAGDAAPALAILLGLVERGIGGPGVVLECARAELDAGEVDGAITRLLQLSAQNSLPLTTAEQVAVALMPTLMGRGRLDDVVQVGERFTATHGLAERVAGILGAAYVDLERFDDARSLVAAAREQGITDPNLDAVAGFVALESGDLAAAEAGFQSALRGQAGNGRALFGCGLAAAYANRLEEACDAFAAATRAMPSHLGSWHALAWIRLVRDDLAGAEQALTQALQQDRTFGDTYGGLAIVAARRGDREASLELIRTGKRLDPHSINVGVAEAMLRHGGDLRNGPTLTAAFQTFERVALARNATLRGSFAKLMARHVRDKTRH